MLTLSDRYGRRCCLSGLRTRDTINLTNLNKRGHMQEGSLPKAFLSFDEAIKLIQAETRDNPRVDISRLARNLKWLEPKHNYTIFMLKRDANGQIVPNGNRPVAINSDYEKSTLEHAIREKYKELARQEYGDEDIHKITTMVTDSESGGNYTGQPMENTESKIKVGDNI